MSSDAAPVSGDRSVSIVITVYNEEPGYLAEAIESALAQRVPAHEIILVEDGARRDYSALLTGYPQVRVIRQQNMGLAAARNTGLRAATGDFILFLDGDDRLTRHAIASNLARFEANPRAIMVYGGWRFINSDGSPSLQVNMPPIGDDPYATLLNGNCIGMHATVLYRRAELLAIGGFDPSYRACEDYELYLRAARQGPIIDGADILAEYRQHDANMSGDRAMMLGTIRRVLTAQEPFVRDNPVWRAARSKGLAAWKAHYARNQLFDILRTASGETRAGPALRGFVRLGLQIPFTMARVAMLETLSRLRARLRHGTVDFGDLRRTKPISPYFGFDRGRPIDRKYIEDFLARHASDVRGRVLEIGDNSYTRQFGGANVTLSEILHVDPDAPNVTYCTDLVEGAGIGDALFDCIVLTQTLHLIYDFHGAVRTLYRILKPGGVILLTVPGVSSVDQGEWGDTWFWSFTPAALRRIFEDRFGRDGNEITSYGNVLTATAFLYGLADEELRPHEFNVVDPHYPVIVAARIQKSGHGASAA